MNKRKRLLLKFGRGRVVGNEKLFGGTNGRFHMGRFLKHGIFRTKGILYMFFGVFNVVLAVLLSMIKRMFDFLKRKLGSIFTTNYKRIGILYMFFGVFNGVLAVLKRMFDFLKRNIFTTNYKIFNPIKKLGDQLENLIIDIFIGMLKNNFYISISRMGTAAGIAVLIYGFIYIKVFDMYGGFENLVSKDELRGQLCEFRSQQSSNPSDIEHKILEDKKFKPGSLTSDEYEVSDEELKEFQEWKSKDKKFKVGEYTYPLFFLSFVCSTLLVGKIVQKIFGY